ncbi:MAG: hypothetical protein ACRD0L_18380 [Acidimicrobiales bacterium]
MNPEGEYRPPAEALGLVQVRLGPGLPGPVNPLDPGPGGEEHLDLARRRASMLVALAASGLSRDASPEERPAVSATGAPHAAYADLDPSGRRVVDIWALTAAASACEAVAAARRGVPTTHSPHRGPGRSPTLAPGRPGPSRRSGCGRPVSRREHP